LRGPALTALGACRLNVEISGVQASNICVGRRKGLRDSIVPENKKSYQGARLAGVAVILAHGTGSRSLRE
jgi:autonomous glycyl radical cofactor GrcA